MAMTVDQVGKECHALALYLLLFNDKNGATFDGFLASKGEIGAAPAVFTEIDSNVFRNAWTVISAGPQTHKDAISAFLAAFKNVSKGASGFGYPDDPDACPALQTVGKLLY